jgi:hypothetical protein
MFVLCCPAIPGQGNNDGFPPVFPVPREAEYAEGFFDLNEKTLVLLPMNPSDQDRFLAHFLVSELAERYDLVLETRKVPDITGMKNFVLMGSVANPLVRDFAAEQNIPVSARDPGREGYCLHVTGNGAVVLGSNDQGAFYGLQSLRQLINRHHATRIQCSTIRDWPHMPFRGIHIYIPGPENISFYKRFIRDFVAYFKFNRIILEVNAVMRFDRHPELNAGWLEFHKDLVYTQRDRPKGPYGEFMDSAHDRAGDGRVLDKDQVADLVDYARRFNITVIPEIPSLTHSFYLLTRHKELAEIQEAEWPDSYCPMNPGSYDLYFDVLDEYIDVIRPEIVSIGHDEWRMAMDVCERCKGRDYTELFIQDVLTLHNYLTAKNIRVGMWGDHFVESHAGKGPQERTVKETGYTYRKPGALTPDQVQEYIPKDILIFNWSWSFKHPVDNVKNFHDWGFEQVLGNFTAHWDGLKENEQRSWENRSRTKGLLGGEASTWCVTSESDIGINRIDRLVSSANHLWSVHYLDKETYLRIIQNLMPDIRIYLKGEKPPSRENNPVSTIDISPSFNTRTTDRTRDIDFGLLKHGILNNYGVDFNLAGAAGRGDNLCATVVQNTSNSGTRATRSERIPVNRDASSLIFLHACAHPAGTKDLLGWYRVVYEDGFEQLIQILYSVNIREWHLWGTDPRTGEPDPCLTGKANCSRGDLCYKGDVINCSKSADREMNFFAYEWTNPRFGIKIKEICLEGADGSLKATRLPRIRDGEVIDENAVALVALSCTTKRDVSTSRAKSAAE